MREVLDSPAFAVFLSLAAYEIGLLANRKTRLALLNPLLVAIVLTIGFLLASGTEYETYKQGGQVISFLLVPATVALALPLYRQFSLLRKNALPILAGIAAGSAANVALVLVLTKMLGLEEVLRVSLVPKSVTTPIGMALSEQIGGLPEITVAAIIITGIAGSILGQYVFRLLRIKDKVAVGVAMGTASHALGTARAIEFGETEGAMSALSIGIAGLATVFLAPLLIGLLL